MTLTFHGVRGSTPCHGREIARYGGNTSCVSVAVPGHQPLLCDLGTGLRYFGLGCDQSEPFEGTCLLSHLHWDHVQGLPFFSPLLREGAHLTVYSPHPEHGGTVAEVMAETIKPPLFPVTLAQLPGTISFVEATNTEFTLHPKAPEGSPIEVMTRLIPHVGATAGYRITWQGRSISYLSDHQQPTDGSMSVAPGALELCRGADVVIHDAQYTPAEFATKSDWGHCTIEYAVHLAVLAQARTLVLFHHDPAHHDDLVDQLAAEAAACGAEHGLKVIAAFEGMTLDIAP
jgi:phosphoribosyl 1,2-cyclic phosphodiesterase